MSFFQIQIDPTTTDINEVVSRMAPDSRLVGAFCNGPTNTVLTFSSMPSSVTGTQAAVLHGVPHPVPAVLRSR